MRFWIEKEDDQKPSENWSDAYVFTVNRDKGSTIQSSLMNTWYHLDHLELKAEYEDLFLIGLSVFALDKRIPRSVSDDGWTRNIEVSIPVLNIAKMKLFEDKWNSLLSFLTGDVWKIEFRGTEASISKHEHKNRKHIDLKGCDCVSLFSGGLDSFCGAIKLLEEGKSPCLIGHNEYPKLRYIQEQFCRDFNECYPNQKSAFISFTAGSIAPINNETGGPLKGSENTSRGRSLLFLCAAVTIAGIMGESTPVYIPENGFIGLNVALTNSRKGSCSTRTTHPHYISAFKSLIADMGIANPIANFFAYNTKREIVNMVKSSEAFKRGYSKTISCSHPCQPRYNKVGSREYPKNCGYCYPCLIRKGSLIDIENEQTSYVAEESPREFLNAKSGSDRSLDFKAVLSSIYRYRHSDEKQINRLIRLTGRLSKEENELSLKVYKSGMSDLIEMLDKDLNMKDLINE